MATAAPASRIEAFDVLIPAGTAMAAPLEVETEWSAGDLVGIEIDIPDGHSGLTGMRVLLAHGQAIPRTAGAWIIGNDDRLAWPLAGFPNSGAYSVQGYNTDRYDHTFHIRYLIADFAYTRAAPIPALAPTPVIV